MNIQYLYRKVQQIREIAEQNNMQFLHGRLDAVNQFV